MRDEQCVLFALLSRLLKIDISTDRKSRPVNRSWTYSLHVSHSLMKKPTLSHRRRRKSLQSRVQVVTHLSIYSLTEMGGNGLDIVVMTASHLEKAYDKLVRWCSSEFRSMGLDALLEVSTELSESARLLRSRPELLACVAPFAGGTSRVLRLPPAYLACIAADAYLARRLTNTRPFRN